MKQLLLVIFGLLLGAGLYGQAPSVAELETALAEAESRAERAAVRYRLGMAVLRDDPDRALELGKQAYEDATELKNDRLSAQTAFLNALAYERLRKDSYEETWLKTTLAYAKRAGDLDLIIRSVDRRSRLATKDRNYRRAYEINQEAFTYFSENGKSISELESQYDLERSRIERERRQLEAQRARLAEEIEILQEEQEYLDEENQQLASSNERKSQQLVIKDETIDSIASRKAEVEVLAAAREKEVKSLSREALEKQSAIDQAERQLAERDLQIAEAKLEAELHRSRSVYAAFAAAFLILLALLLYNRFAAKKRTAAELAEKNRIIGEERERSENLLLNVLPAPIAEELKEHGAVRAKRFEEVTVLFSDFVNFTHISEQLTPEELVSELDKCFKAFDQIISQYDDLEKIKTIGDAYMCACGLNNRKSYPHNLVRAALEMQEFLEGEKEARRRIGKPWFEARIGMHTGPVVAGVVGVRKFAYDIWGDTVNVAARMENNCEPGRVNLSQTTFELVRYQFDCDYRGPVPVKNKGMLGMYYVQKERIGMAVGQGQL